MERLNVHDIALMKADNKRVTASVEEYQNATRSLIGYDEENNGFCVAASLVFIFGAEHLDVSRVLKEENVEAFYETIKEICFTQDIDLSIPTSSGEFLDLLEEDGFMGLLIAIDTKGKYGHVIASRAMFDVSDEDGSIVRKFVVLDTEQEMPFGIFGLEEMVDLYTKCFVFDHPDGEITRTVFCFSKS